MAELQEKKKIRGVVKVTIDFRKKGAWSNNSKFCRACKSIEKKHFAKGLCKTCYYRAYRDAVKVFREKNMDEARRMIDSDN